MTTHQLAALLEWIDARIDAKMALGYTVPREMDDFAKIRAELLQAFSIHPEDPRIKK